MDVYGKVRKEERGEAKEEETDLLIKFWRNGWENKQEKIKRKEEGKSKVLNILLFKEAKDEKEEV